MDLSTDEALKRAKLNLSDRDQKGITRKELKKNSDEGSFEWAYYLPDKKRLKNEKRIAECNSLAIPPAWNDVWICPDDRGHIQATGVDDKGRLQYRYLSLIHI